MYEGNGNGDGKGDSRQGGRDGYGGSIAAAEGKRYADELFEIPSP